jgi:hypothetical protein
MEVMYNINYNEEMVVSLVKGNSKLGKKVFSFNLLPGDKPISTKDKGKLTNVWGTCAGCCSGCKDHCYAVRDARLHHNAVIPSAGKNTVIMRHDMDKGFKQIKEALIKNKAKVLRLHSSGEIMNYDYLLHMVKLAVEMPDVLFYFYTKRFAFMQQYIKECGALPENLVCNISEWKGNTEGYQLDGLNKFVYDDGTDPTLEKLVHCPAVNKKGGKTGVTCSQCQRCFSGNKGIITAVYDH